MDDPGGLSVAMKLSAAVNRVAGAQNNVRNAISFLEVQDGMLDSSREDHRSDERAQGLGYL